METRNQDTSGIQWSQSIVPEKGARVCLKYWCDMLTMPIVYERLNYFYQLGDPGFQHLITQFSMRAYRLTVSPKKNSCSYFLMQGS